MSIVSLGADAIIVSTTRFLLTRYGQPLCFPEVVNNFSWCAWILHSHTGIGNGWSQAMLLLPSLQPTPAKCQSRATMLGLSVTPRRWWVGLNCSREIPYLKSSRKVYRFSHCAQDKYKVNSPFWRLDADFSRQLREVGEHTLIEEIDTFPTGTFPR